MAMIPTEWRPTSALTLYDFLTQWRERIDWAGITVFDASTDVDNRVKRITCATLVGRELTLRIDDHEDWSSSSYPQETRS